MADVSERACSPERDGSSGWRGWSRGALFVVAAVVAALVSGCTSDDGVVVSTEEFDAEMALASAVEGMTSGRFRLTFSVTLDDTGLEGVSQFLPSVLEHFMVSEGSFVGDRVSTTTTGEGLFGEVGAIETRLIDGTQYFSLGDGVSDALFGMDTVENIGERLDGRTWLALDQSEVLDPAEAMVFGRVDSPVQLLDGATQVDHVAPREYDGETMQVLTARLQEPEQRLPAETAIDSRVAAIQQYRAEHSYGVAEVLIDADGRMRRIEITTIDEIEEQYRSCVLLATEPELGLVVEFYDLGADIEIEAPPADTVVSALEWQTILSEAVAGHGQVWPGATTTTEVSGSPGIPTYSTPVGELDRPGLERMVTMGLEMLGADPVDLTQFTDEELVELIQAYIDNLYEFDVDVPDEELNELYEGCPG